MKPFRFGVTVLSLILVTLVVTASDGCRRPVRRARGGPVSGSLFYEARLDKAAGGEETSRIALPDIEVFLQNPTSGVKTAAVTTDFFGRYRFPHQPPGTYQLRWNAQRGWAAGGHPDQIVIDNGPRFPTAAPVRPDERTGVIFGHVTLGDAGTPWSYDELFSVNHTATVTILNAARTATLGGPVHTNAEGRYAVAGLPRSEPTTIRVQSQAATVTRALGPGAISVGNPVASTDVQLANRRPEILTMIPQAGGALIKTAAPGAIITIVAGTRDLDSDPLQYEWATATGHGAIAGAAAGTANWTLPPAPGRYSAYVQVGDGRGGWARQRIDFTSARTTDRFSGVAVNKFTGAPIAGAAVVVNGQAATTDGNGFFSVNAPLTNRYVMTIDREGFATFSRVVDSGMTGQRWLLVPTQSQTVDPTGVIDLVDRRPELERKQRKGARVRVPANALVGPGGVRPTGMLTAHIATLLIDEGEAPGDWGAMLGGKEMNLISYGAAFVEFRDAKGTIYNLAPGMQADVEMFAPPAMLPAAPAKVRLWSYDTADGYWKESGTSNLNGPAASFVGQVSHFSTINTDLEKDNAACLKALLYPPIPTGVKLRVTDPSGSVFSQSFEFVLDSAINAVYRLPANTDVRLEVLNADNSPYGAPVLLEEVPGTPLPGNVVNTGPQIPPGQDLFPPEPYETCKLVILREANEPTALAFLAFKGAGSSQLTQGYYAGVDPNNERTTLGAWWSKNGFTFDGAGLPTNGVRTSYLNNNDLGSGRDMHFLQRGDGTAAAYVTNYGLFNQDHGNADLAADRIDPGATVAMEYSPVEGQGATRVVKFFVYNGAGGGASAPRVEFADLDGFGPKFVPNLCNNCHGGSYFPANAASPTFAEINMGAAFRELDIATYKFPGGRLVANNAEKDAFRSQNLIVKGAAAADTITLQGIKDLITGWYAGGTNDQDNNFTPPGWAGAPQQGLYHDVVKPSCRTCHVGLDGSAADSGIGWISYAQLELRQGFLDSFVLCDGRLMPHAVITYRNFWLSASPHRPASLRNFANGGGWPAIGPCS